MDDVNVSVRGFAREVGISHVRVLKLLKEGRLPRNEDGTIPLRAGIEAYKKIAEKKSSKAKRVVPGGVPDPSESVNINVALNKAKLAEKTYTARLKELEYKIKTGEILLKADVEADARMLAERVKTRLLAVPSRISAMCEGRIARDIEEIMADAINDAMRDLQKLRNGGEMDAG